MGPNRFAIANLTTCATQKPAVPEGAGRLPEGLPEVFSLAAKTLQCRKVPEGCRNDCRKLRFKGDFVFVLGS